MLFLVGTFPVLSLLVGQAVLRITEEAGCQTPTQGITETDIFSSNKEVLECETIGASVAVTLAFMAGIIMVRLKRIHFIVQDVV